MLCYCVLHVLRHFVHWNWCIKAMCSAVACCNSSVLCNSVCADRSGTAAPRLLEGRLFFSTVLRFWLCFASPCSKSDCSGCMKVANGALVADFFILVLMIFRLKFLLKSASKWSFFRDPVLELQFMLLQLSLCRSQWNGCVKVSRCCGWVRNTILQLRVVNRIVMAASAYTMRSCRHGCNNLLWQQLHRRRLSLAVLSLACRLATSACRLAESACRRLVFADPWCG